MMRSRGMSLSEISLLSYLQPQVHFLCRSKAGTWSGDRRVVVNIGARRQVASTKGRHHRVPGPGGRLQCPSPRGSKHGGGTERDQNFMVHEDEPMFHNDKALVTRMRKDIKS
jgi:hypothetical protein